MYYIWISVNKEDVTDGNKGCERAVLLTECFNEKKMDVSPL